MFRKGSISVHLPFQRLIPLWSVKRNSAGRESLGSELLSSAKNRITAHPEGKIRSKVVFLDGCDRSRLFIAEVLTRIKVSISLKLSVNFGGSICKLPGPLLYL